MPGQNIALADLFDLDHAGKVLAAFGRAFGKLPENPRDTSKQQQAFLAQALRGLSQDGKVVCIRLALFAEMMKGKPWTRAGESSYHSPSSIWRTSRARQCSGSSATGLTTAIRDGSCRSRMRWRTSGRSTRISWWRRFKLQRSTKWTILSRLWAARKARHAKRCERRPGGRTPITTGNSNNRWLS